MNTPTEFLNHVRTKYIEPKRITNLYILQETYPEAFEANTGYTSTHPVCEEVFENNNDNKPAPPPVITRKTSLKSHGKAKSVSNLTKQLAEKQKKEEEEKEKEKNKIVREFEETKKKLQDYVEQTKQQQQKRAEQRKQHNRRRARAISISSSCSTSPRSSPSSHSLRKRYNVQSPPGKGMMKLLLAANTRPTIWAEFLIQRGGKKMRIYACSHNQKHDMWTVHCWIWAVLKYMGKDDDHPNLRRAFSESDRLELCISACDGQQD